MKNFTSVLNGDATDWLLDESNPFVRYHALRWLLDKPESDRQVSAAREAIAGSAPVQKILARQRPEGYWGSDGRPHHGTHGPLGLLLWLGYSGSEGVQKAMEYRLAGCLQGNAGYGITIKGKTAFLPCHGAEVLRQMLRFGYADDPRAPALLDWLVRLQQADGYWPCVSKVKSFSCAWATADVLRALSDLPPKFSTPKVKAARRCAAELFLNSPLGIPARRNISPRWFSFGYPLFWDSDILDVLELVAPFVGPDDPRIQPALERVLSKQNRDGQWACEKHPQGSMWMERYVEFDEIGKPSKWVTLHAYRMLKTLYAEPRGKGNAA